MDAVGLAGGPMRAPRLPLDDGRRAAALRRRRCAALRAPAGPA